MDLVWSVGREKKYLLEGQRQGCMRLCYYLITRKTYNKVENMFSILSEGQTKESTHSFIYVVPILLYEIAMLIELIFTSLISIDH